MKEEQISEFETISSRPVEEVSKWWNEKTYQEQKEFSRFLAGSANEEHHILLDKLFCYSPNGDKVTNGVFFAQKVLGDNSIKDISKNVTL